MAEIKIFLIKIFVTGAICAFALIISGSGAKKEIVRLACAAVMIIVVLTSIKGISFDMGALGKDISGVEHQIENSIKQANENQVESVRKSLEDYFAAKAGGLNISCKIGITFTQADDNSVAIAGVFVRHLPCNDADLQALISLIIEECGIKKENVVTEEVESLENFF